VSAKYRGIILLQNCFLFTEIILYSAAGNFFELPIYIMHGEELTLTVNIPCA
jgi:hypothetical protein